MLLKINKWLKQNKVNGQDITITIKNLNHQSLSLKDKLKLVVHQLYLQYWDFWP